MAGFDIQAFRSELDKDGARPNLFEITIPIPAFAAVGNSVDVSRKITFFARAASLPGDSIGQAVTNYFGRQHKVPGNRTFNDWSVTIINDEDFAIRNSLERWMNALNSHRSNIRSAAALSPLQYSVDAFVYQYSKLGPATKPLKQYKLIGIYPIDLTPIELDWGSSDVIEEFGATFSVQWWEDQSGSLTT